MSLDDSSIICTAGHHVRLLCSGHLCVCRRRGWLSCPRPQCCCSSQKVGRRRHHRMSWHSSSQEGRRWGGWSPGRSKQGGRTQCSPPRRQHILIQFFCHLLLLLAKKTLTSSAMFWFRNKHAQDLLSCCNSSDDNRTELRLHRSRQRRPIGRLHHNRMPPNSRIQSGTGRHRTPPHSWHGLGHGWPQDLFQSRVKPRFHRVDPRIRWPQGAQSVRKPPPKKQATA